MQAQVDEIRRDVVSHWPLARRFGDHQRNPIRTQQIDETLLEKALVPDLDRMPQSARGAARKARTASHPGRVFAGERVGVGRIPRQQLEEGCHLRAVVAEVRRELPQHRPQFLT